MRTSEFIQNIEDNGGFNMNQLRSNYNYDVKNKYHRGSFRSWFVSMLMNHESLSRYVANKVADYYNV